MPKLDWDDNEGPLAYLITFRTFGTWLHGDERYSVDRHGKNIYGTPGIAPNEKLSTIMSEKMQTSAFKLDGKQRVVVESAIRSVCEIRGYGLLALNIRTNHAHSVVSAWKNPNAIMSAFKANATRELRWPVSFHRLERSGREAAVQDNFGSRTTWTERSNTSYMVRATSCRISKRAGRKRTGGNLSGSEGASCSAERTPSLPLRFPPVLALSA